MVVCRVYKIVIGKSSSFVTSVETSIKNKRKFTFSHNFAFQVNARKIVSKIIPRETRKCIMKHTHMVSRHSIPFPFKEHKHL